MKFNKGLNFEDLKPYKFRLRETGEWVYYMGTKEHPSLATIRVLPDRSIVIRMRNPDTLELPAVLIELIKEEVFV